MQQRIGLTPSPDSHHQSIGDELRGHVAQPLGVAVLGAEVDDEIQFLHGKGTRSAVIERIERGVN
jgi:hypothetical protein